MICALLIFQDPELPAPLAEVSPWLDWGIEPIETVRARLAAQRHRRVIKTHTPLDGLPLRPDVTYVVVGRHPLDVAESLYHHGHNIDRDRFEALTGRRTLPPEGSFADWVDWWVDPPEGPGEKLDTLPGLVHHIEDAWARRHQPNVVLAHYGDLSNDTEGEMRRLADRLGIHVSHARWPALVDAASFGSMRRNAERSAPDHLGVLKDHQAFFRSGTTGGGDPLVSGRSRHLYDTSIHKLARPEVVDWLHRGWSTERREVHGRAAAGSGRAGPSPENG